MCVCVCFKYKYLDILLKMKLKHLMFNNVKSKWHTQILLFENNLAKLLTKENKQYVIGASDVHELLFKESNETTTLGMNSKYRKK